jgi:peroxiredoxin Q/BCP
MNKLNENDLAPDFCLKNQDEEYICLYDFIGKNVVLYFYPKY